MQKVRLTHVERQFPPLYEKIIPVAIMVLTVLIIGTLILTIGVAMGWLIF